MQQSDFTRFKALIGRLCDIMGKPMSEELLDGYWKSLLNCDLEAIEATVDDYIARAGENTRFPRPSQLRPKHVAIPVAEDSTNYQRGYWRTVIVNTVANALGTDMVGLEPIIIANRESLGAWMLTLLNDVCGKDTGGDRSAVLQSYCEARSLQIAARFNGTTSEHRPESLNWFGDNWDVAANKHLLALVVRGGKFTVELTAALVKWKNKWAQAMREEATSEGVEVSYQREVWDSYMTMARQETP